VTAQQSLSPPEQKPLAQWVGSGGEPHVWPSAPSHAPAALHTWFAGQPPFDPSASSPQLIPPAHLAQGPAQATLQQTLSPPEQKPLAQSLPIFDGLHVWLLTASQAPAALHAWFAGQAPCDPSASSPQVVPPAHEAQGPAQATAQQTLSPPEQKPLAQSLPLFVGLHAWLVPASQAPAALHAWFAGQAPCDPSASSPQVIPPAHLAQGPAQATLQQTLSPPEQKPLAQSPPLSLPPVPPPPPPFVEHAAPSALPWGPPPPQPTEAKTITVRMVRTAARVEPSQALRCGVSIRPDLCSRFITLISSPS
jgi:hypothetical protein